MTSEVQNEITKALNDIGIKVTKFIEEKNSSDPVRVYLDNVPESWDDPDTCTCTSDEVKDELHDCLNKHFTYWEIIPVDGSSDGMPDNTWLLHGY